MFSDELINDAAQAPRHRRDHRGHAGPDRAERLPAALPRPVLRRRHRRAARDDARPPVWRWAVCIRSWPSTRRSSTGRFDQLMMDVALHKLPVTHGARPRRRHRPDGASHNGMWDLSMLGIVPGMRVAAPRDARPAARRNSARRSTIKDGPDRHPVPQGRCGRGHSGARAARRGRRAGGARPTACPTTCCWSRSDRSPRWRWRSPSGCSKQGIGVTVVDPRWVLPVPDAVVRWRPRTSSVVTLEDNGVHGGVGSAVSAALRRAEIDVPCRDVGCAAGVLRPRVARRGADRGRLDRPAHRPPDHRLGGRALWAAPAGEASVTDQVD